MASYMYQGVGAYETSTTRMDRFLEDSVQVTHLRLLKGDRVKRNKLNGEKHPGKKRYQSRCPLKFDPYLMDQEARRAGNEATAAELAPVLCPGALPPSVPVRRTLSAPTLLGKKLSLLFAILFLYSFTLFYAPFVQNVD